VLEPVVPSELDELPEVAALELPEVLPESVPNIPEVESLPLCWAMELMKLEAAVALE